MSYQTRQEYKEAMMQDIYLLVQAIETEDEKGRYVAHSLYHNVREFFHADRWKPTPVSDTLTRMIPRDELLTFRFQHFEPQCESDRDRAVLWVTGRMTALHARYSPEDGAYFDVVPVGIRKPRRYGYRTGHGTSLTIWKGKVTPEDVNRREPLFDHATMPSPASGRRAS